MPTGIRLGAAAMLLAGGIGQATAEEATLRLYDERIERATAQRAAERIGELRGTIDPRRHADAIVTGAVGDGAPDAGKEPAPSGDGHLRLIPKSGPRIRLMLVPAPAFRKLPPIVDNGAFAPDIDPVMTGSVGSALRLDLAYPVAHLRIPASRTE
jgi:hypothetical protein